MISYLGLSVIAGMKRVQFTKKKIVLGQKPSDKLNKLNPRGLQCSFFSFIDVVASGGFIT